jgi:hypothetical protein
MLFDDRTSLQKWNDTMMKPAAWADALAWGRIWRACESNISRKTNLSKGSNEFYEAVNTLFNEVIDKTQVVDGVLQRTHAMRDANALMKQMTSFMGEPSMTLNMILRDFDAWSKETDVTKKRKARHALSRSITAVLAANTANAIVQSIVDGWRDDDDEKDYRERVVKAFSGLETGKEEGWDKFFATMSSNFGSSFNPLTYVPIAKDVVSIAQGYDVVRMDADIMADVITAFQAFMDSVNGEGTKTVEYNFSKMVHAISKSCGISTTNVVRDVAGLTRTLFADSELALQYELEKAIYKIDNKENNGKFYDLLYQARKQNDTVVYNQIVKELTANGTKTESIKSAMTSRTKKEKEAAKK